MLTETFSENRVAKKKSSPPADIHETGRIELKADPSFIVELDQVAVALGLGRSAYIRQALVRQMNADRRALGLDPSSEQTD